jgi:hypothetical protein
LDFNPSSVPTVGSRRNRWCYDLATDEIELRVLELLAGAAVFHAAQVGQLDLHLVDGQLRDLQGLVRAPTSPLNAALRATRSANVMTMTLPA